MTHQLRHSLLRHTSSSNPARYSGRIGAWLASHVRVLMVTLIGVSLTGTLGLSLFAQSGDTHVGDLFGDLVHIKRHPVTGQPILQKRDVLLAGDVPGVAYCPIPVDVNGFELPFLPLSCDPDPAYADAMVEVDYFGRLSGGRTKEGNLRMHFDESINGIKNADVVTLDPAGRLLLGSDCTAVDACASWKTIDSPMENLSIYRRLMKYGHLQTDPLEEDTSMGGDPAAGTIYHPALDATDWAKFTGPTTALLPRGASSQCFSGSVFDVTCAAPQALTSNDFILSGSFLAGAADKTGRITPDLVHYLNRILKITVATPESAATLNTLPALIRDENGAITTATPDLPAPANELFVDYAAATYLRSDWFSKSVLVLQETGGVWVPTSVDLMTWLNFINGPMSAAAAVLPAFVASTSDALRVVEFLHNYEIPADLWANPAATLTTVSPVTVAYSAVNRNVVLTASVTSQSATPVVGSVMFFVRTAQDAAVGTPVAAAVVNGIAAAAYVLPGGTQPQTLSIVASFTPTGPFAASQGSSTLTITQDPAASVIQNGSFSAGAVGWQIYATPDLSYIVSNVTNGVMEFYRVPPPPGEINQAVVFQETGLALPEDALITAQFDLGNSSSVRKRISVLILEHDFSDITMCTFTLPANAPLRTYGMRTHSTTAWTNAAIYFYAATEGSDGGFYQIDNVSLIPDPTGPAAVTQCIDPTVPAPGVGADSADLLTNGDFTAGLPPWVLFGQITAQITAGVLEFVRPAGVPAGVILQTTDQALPSQDLLTARFSLGNSSTVRKRVTAILHDADFSDLAACTFNLEPGQPLAEHMMYAFTTEPWVNATVSFYPATVGTEGWMQLDNVSLKRTPALATLGVTCMEPAAVSALATSPAGSAALTSSTVSAAGGTTSTTSAVATLPILTAPMDDGATDWQATPLFTLGADAAFGGTGLGWSAVATDTAQGLLWWMQPLDLRNAASARFRFQSRLATVGSTAAVEVSSDGVAWHKVAGVPGSADWTLLDMDLSAYVGRVVFVRFVFDAVAPAAAGLPPDTWWIDEVEVEVIPSASGIRLGTGL